MRSRFLQVVHAKPSGAIATQRNGRLVDSLFSTRVAEHEPMPFRLDVFEARRLLLAEAGLRRSEAAALTINDVSEQRRARNSTAIATRSRRTGFQVHIHHANAAGIAPSR